MSYRFQRFMAHDYKTSPFSGLPFDPYRRFGFAKWDDQLMIVLGFARHDRRALLETTFYYLRWRDILTEEERSLCT